MSFRTLLAACFLGIPAVAQAEDSLLVDSPVTQAVLIGEGSNGLIAFAILALLVFLGMALISTGSARAKNAASTSINQIVILACSVVAFIGVGELLLSGRLPSASWRSMLFAGDGAFPESRSALLLFQAVFVAIALSVSCRSMIDRIRLRGLIVFSVLFSGLVFPIFAQWAWGSRFVAEGTPIPSMAGWLEVWGVGFYDFAGAGVIHIVGGAFALAGALVLGVRRGRLLSGGILRFEPGHNPVLISFGVIFALIGWFGFHLGFDSFASNGAAKLIVATLLAACSAGLTAMFSYRIFYGATGFHTTLHGVVGGLVAASACATSLSPVSALIVGAVAGLVVVIGTSVVEKLCIDDSGSAIPAHLFCGFWGVVSVSLFGPDEMRGIEGLKTQVFGAGVLGLSAFVVALVLFKLIDNLVGLRVSEQDQLLGSDFNEHSLNAYPGFEKVEE